MPYKKLSYKKYLSFIRILQNEVKKNFLDGFLSNNFVQKSSDQIDAKELSLDEELKRLRTNLEKAPSEGEVATLRRKSISFFIPGIPIYPFLERAVMPLIQEYVKDGHYFFSDIERARAEIFRSMPSLKPHSLSHFFAQPKYLFGSIQCKNFFHSLFGARWPFDPKRFLGNLSGILWSEEIHAVQEKERAPLFIDWNIGPTPTIGVHISPEAESFCSLVRAADSSGGEQIKYSGWTYINLQNRRDKNERMRARAIESLASKYRGKVLVASITVDAPHYRALQVGQDCSLSMERDRLLQILFSRPLFHLDSESWYYFSVFDEKSQIIWMSVLRHVIDAAYSLIAPFADKTDFQLIRAFQELAVWGICRAWQGWTAAHYLSERSCAEHSSPLFLLSTISCREGVDRGGTINGGMISLLAEESYEAVFRKALSIMWGRPILFRGRLSEKERSQGFFFLLEKVDSLPRIKNYLRTQFDIGYTAFEKTLFQ